MLLKFSNVLAAFEAGLFSFWVLERAGGGPGRVGLPAWGAVPSGPLRFELVVPGLGAGLVLADRHRPWEPEPGAGSRESGTGAEAPAAHGAQAGGRSGRGLAPSTRRRSGGWMQASSGLQFAVPPSKCCHVCFLGRWVHGPQRQPRLAGAP